MLLFLILGLVIGAVSVVFVLQNITPITVTFLTWHLDGSLAVILLLALISGMLMSALILLPSFIRSSWQVKRLQKRLRQYEDDAVLNSTPVASSVVQPMPVEREPAIDLDEELK